MSPCEQRTASRVTPDIATSAQGLAETLGQLGAILAGEAERRGERPTTDGSGRMGRQHPLDPERPA